MNQHDRMSLYIYICLYPHVATKTDDFTLPMDERDTNVERSGSQAPISGARKHAWPSRRLRRLVGFFVDSFGKKKKRFFWERTKSNG